MDIDKIGAFVVHMIACGTFLAASYLTNDSLLQSAIFIELTAIYFNTRND